SLQYALSFESGPIFPADNYEEGDIFIRCASESVSTKEFSATWENIRIGISLRELLGIGENTTEMPMSSKNRVEYISTQYNLRADGVHLIKTCLKAQADLDNDNSRLFIDTKRNDTYVAGESIEVWGNIALTDDPAKIMNGADPICEYYILEGVSGSVETDEQTYYEEMEKQFGFDCEMDQGFFLPTGNSSAIFQFEGEIASADETAIQGSVEMKLQVDGQEYETADTEAKAIQNGDSLIFQTIGSMENKGNDRSAFNFFQLEILNNRITILDEDDHYINSDPLNGVRAALIYVEELIVETDHYAKLTPIAVNIPMQRGLFVCHDDNPSFAPGEILQLAGNIELTSDKSILILAFGALTYCEKNGLSIPCQEFEEAALLKA
ncbi:MAG: hypothetical protein GY847_12115, partial [Proteobacteria bacterium]|nr:hypothetical protein [Pseudomonadota bacterium]